MSKNNFFQDRNRSNLEKLKKLQGDLPSFCVEYFIGIGANTSPLTRLNYAYDLRIFFDFLSSEFFDNKPVKDFNLQDLNKLDVFHIELFLNYLSSYTYNSKKNSCNDKAKARKLSSVRNLFKYFFNKDKLDSNITTKVLTPKLKEKEIIRLESNSKVDEISDLLDEVEYGYNLTDRQKKLRTSLTKARDMAIFTLFLGTGIRISELIGLNNSDINFKNNSFIITRKGGNEAILYFSDEVAHALKEYMQFKKLYLADTNDDSLFLSSTTYKRISVRAVQNIVKKYSRPVTPLKNISPHKLRSTYGTQLYRATGDIYQVADVLGHRDVNTTKKHYAAITDDIRKSIANKVRLRDDD